MSALHQPVGPGLSRAARSAAAPAVPAGQPVAPRPGRTRLHVVRPPNQHRTRTPFVAVCMAVLVAALGGTLLLNTAMAQGEYERFALQSRLSEAAQRQEQLVVELEQRSSPARIAQAARALGMVPSAGSGYLRLEDGAVLGEPTPAPGPPAG